MKQAQQSIYYCNFDVDTNKIKNLIPQTKIKALIMGSCGTGKTAFINKSCNTKHDSETSTGSLTKDVACQDICYFPPGFFKIYDTPGTDSMEKTLQHAQVLRAGLTSVPLNLILIFVKFGARWDRVFEQFSEQFKIFEKYSNLVVLVISHYDHIKQKDKLNAFQKFQETQKLYKLQIPILFYSNETSNIKTVVQLLYSIGTKNQPLSIEVDDETFYQHFKIANPAKINEIPKYINQIEKKCQFFINAFKSLNKDTKDIDEFVADLKIKMKSDLKKLQDEQYEKYNAEFNDDYMTYDLYLRISMITHDYMQQADAIADKLLTKSVYEDFYNKTTDIKDMLKKCPKCGEIWMKVRDQDITFCGNRPTNYFDCFNNKNVYKHQFKIQNKELTYTKNEMKKPDKSKIKNQMEVITQNAKNIKPVGCGTPLQWNKLDRLSNIEQIIREYYGTSNYSEIKLELEFVSKDHAAYNAEILKKVQETKKLMSEGRTSQEIKKPKAIEILKGEKYQIKTTNIKKHEIQKPCSTSCSLF